jgi:hypothetical protein
MTGVPDAASLALGGVADIVSQTASQAVAEAGATAESAVSAVSSGVSSAVSNVTTAASNVASAASDVASTALSAIGLQLASRTDIPDRPDEDPVAVRASLGQGEPLEAATRVRLEQAFGRSLADIRVHHDAAAASAADRLAAHALTVGTDIAFAHGEYRPGTMVGDALIAHELAHAVQQSGSQDSAANRAVDAAPAEAAADRSSVAALASLWGGRQVGLAGLIPSSPRRSGLQLARCASTTRAVATPATVLPQAPQGPWADAVAAAENEPDESRKNIALAALVQRALGGRRVRSAGKSSPDAVVVADYDPAPTINFDPRLNLKRRWQSQRLVGRDVGYTFTTSVGGARQSFPILGPDSISARRGEVHTRMYADHELYHAADPQAGELAAWTDTFRRYFLATYMNRESWDALIGYYEDASQPAQQASLGSIVDFANGLSNAPGTDRSSRSERERFDVWLRRRLRDATPGQLVRDLGAQLGITAEAPRP